MLPRSLAASHCQRDQRCTGTCEARTRRVKSSLSKQAVAGEEGTPLGEPLVRRDEVGRRDAITVVEDEIVGARRRGGAVADRRQAKALVLVPHVRDREGRPLRERLHHRARLGRRAVVGHDELEIEIVLREESFEHGSERIGAVVGGDDDRGAHQPFSRRAA